ncbi:MAG: DnaJ domain-containing protein [Bellilinea sp.]
MEFYNLLNLPFDATPDEIRTAYFNAARKFHPDATNGSADGKVFIGIQNAYEVLSDPKKRKAYDLTVPKKAREKSAVDIEAIYSRKYLFQTDDPQLLYVVLNISTTNAFEPENRSPIHLCVILDRSTSMRGTRMDMVQSNLHKLIRWLNPNDVISMVAFSDRAEVILKPTACKNINSIEASLYGVQTSGATEIYQGLELGFDLFKRFAGNGTHAKHLLLVTDGHTYGDEERCYQLAERANLEGIVINAIGIGDEWNDKFLDRLSGMSGGNTVFIRDDQDLKKYIEHKLRSLQVNFARKSEIHLELPDNVELKYAFRNQPDVYPLEINLPIQIGPVEYNRKTSVIFEFNIKEISMAANPWKIASGKIFLDITDKLIPLERYYFHLELPLSKQWINYAVPVEVMAAMSKISLYRLQEKAKGKVNEGDIEGATRYLRYLATRLTSQGDGRLAVLALSEAEHLEKYGNYSRDGEKVIKYGTRSLFMLPGPEIADYD